MTIAKVRNLSKFGVITDADPYSLPPQGYSRGTNVRFRDGSITRAPVFRRVPVTLSDTDPRFICNNIPTSGLDTLYVGYLSGRISAIDNEVEDNVSIAGYVDSDADEPWSSCHLADVLYINRGDRVPWKIDPDDTDFAALANWNANWRAKILRAAGGALCAFGITDTGVSSPTKIKTSSFVTTPSAVPSSWDHTDPSTNATENILAEMEGPITDAMNLGEGIIVYGYKEAWAMTPTTSSAVWDYRKLPFDSGSLGVNCSVEVGGMHYVFGPNDIWRHDGVSKQSIADHRVQSYVFQNIDLSKANRCFVEYDAKRKELRFCYVSGDDTVAFPATSGCNRSAVYSLIDEVWSFDDLPNVYEACTSNLDTSLTWSVVTDTWESIGGSWLDQADTMKKTLVMIGDVNASFSLSSSIYATDEQGPGSIISYPVDQNATVGWELQQDGIDLDELPEVVDNKGYKVLSSIFPQARFEAGASSIEFAVGGADNYNDTVTFSDWQTYDGDTYVRCDFNVAGRYLFLKIRHDDYHYVKLTGYDLDILTTGEE